MKRILTRTTVLAALAMVILTASAVAAEVGTGVITASSLRMRKEPTTNSATIVLIGKGTKVSVHEQLDGWYKIVVKPNADGNISGRPIQGKKGEDGEWDKDWRQKNR